MALSYCFRHFVVILMFLAHQCTKFHCESIHHKQVIGTNTIYKIFRRFLGLFRLFVVVFKLVIFVLTNAYHGTSVYQVSL